MFVSVIGSHVSAKLQPWSPTFSARRWSLQSADKKTVGEERFREDEDVQDFHFFERFFRMQSCSCIQRGSWLQPQLCVSTCRTASKQRRSAGQTGQEAKQESPPRSLCGNSGLVKRPKDLRPGVCSRKASQTNTPHQRLSSPLKSFPLRPSLCSLGFELN